MLTVVAGPCGAGKTHWIWQEMSAQKDAKSLLYISPATVGVDAYRLCLNMPGLGVKDTLPETLQSLRHLAAQKAVYVELGYHLDPDLPALQGIPHRRVAVVSPNCQTRSDWIQWTDEVVTNVIPLDKPGTTEPATSEPATSELGGTIANMDLWQASMDGQVLDPASLNTFWEELVEGAYGQLNRAKAIFELADGDAIYVDHLPQQETTYQALPLPKWLNGRPQRFSGIEMVGQGLDKGAIAATLQDCCLDDATLKSHQAALKESQAYLSQDAA